MTELIELLSREAYIYEEEIQYLGETFYITISPPDKEDNGYVLLRRGMMLRLSKYDALIFENCLSDGGKAGNCNIFVEPPHVYAKRNIENTEAINEKLINQLVRGLFIFWDSYFDESYQYAVDNDT